ncbi:MAG: hypothetical protein GTO41_03495, partial [Burkholderiales bacterium]|nr:hypothetical protein [Burkholderiales bacterium]
MKTISSISALALAMQSVWAMPVFSAPVVPMPQPEMKASTPFQIDCHDDFGGEEEDFEGQQVLISPL